MFKFLGIDSGRFLERRRKEFYALRSTTLDLKKGECLGIVGRNGAGKSTLLQLISGILRPTHGTVAVQGKVAALLELGAGFDDEFTGRENVYMNASIYGFDREDVDKLMESILDFAEIGAFIDEKVRVYSNGMRLRLAFSILVFVEPDILIIDEALAVGDAAFVQKCMRWLNEFIKTKTVIIVSHDVFAITTFCSRAIWMADGKIVCDGDPKNVTELYLESAYQDDSSVEFKISQPAVKAGDVCDGSILDVREPIFKREGFSNCLKLVAPFNPDSISFGMRKASIIEVRFMDSKNRSLEQIKGGEIVTIEIIARADSDISAPIIGFGVKNKYGQELFHDNTFLTSHANGSNDRIYLQGSKLSAKFTFRMPYFPGGEYFMFAAIATGTHFEHEQQHWVHEAIRFTATPDRICLGLIGIPMIRVTLSQCD